MDFNEPQNWSFDICLHKKMFCLGGLALIYENAVVFTVRRPFGAHIPNGLISDKAKDNFLETRCSLG